MLYVQLDVNWPDHPKLLRAGIDGAGLHATAMCLAKRLNTDGWIDVLLLHRYGATDDLIARLVDLELLEVDGARVRPWDWLDRNPSQAAIAAKRATKSDGGRAGNHKRWGHPGDVDDCERCTPKPQVVAGCDTDAIGSDSAATPQRSPIDIDIDIDKASSDGLAPATTPESRRAVLAAAAEIIGERAAQRPGAENPGSVRAAVAAGIVRNRYADAFAHLAAYPDTTPPQLAEWLEPTSSPKPRHEVNTSRHIPLVGDPPPSLTEEQRAASRAAMKQLPRLLRRPAGDVA